VDPPFRTNITLLEGSNTLQNIKQTSSFGTLAADATIKDGGIFNKIFDS
jgi:hypothetical protein